MTKIYRAKSMFARFFKNTAGSMAMVWGVIGVGIIITVGAAYDVNQVSKAKAIAQMAADNMALTASIAVDTDNENRFEEGQTYSYRNLGGPQDDFTDSMEGVVTYDILDETDQKKDENGDLVFDENGNPVYEKLLARATVSGTYTPAFIAALGINSIDFEATSDVAYAKREGKPASIFFVTDNSGSMGSRDNNGVRKISSLKTSMKSFMNILDQIKRGDRVFRTALFPYNSNLIYGKIVNPKWETLSNYNINLMSAAGGTRSTVALQRASNKFSLENAIHEAENSETKPLKFLIFMSDGANNGVTTRTVCQDEQVWVPEGSERWVLHYRGSNYTYYSYRWWFKFYDVTYYPASDGGYQTQEVCTEEYYSPVNEASLEVCTAMKNNGVQIYAIAYDVSASEREMAENFMKTCSSGEDVYYKYASTGADLQEVFEEIGEAVVKEVIRVKR